MKKIIEDENYDNYDTDGSNVYVNKNIDTNIIDHSEFDKEIEEDCYDNIYGSRYNENRMQA